MNQIETYVKLFQRYIDRNFGGFPKYDVKSEGEEIIISTIVDISKCDLNSPNYDESYRKLFYKKRPEGVPIWIERPEGKMLSIIDNIYRFFGKKIPIRYSWEAINYSYLEDIENKVQRAIKDSDYPEINVEIGGEILPKVAIIFKNIPEEIRGRENFIEFYNDLNLYTKLKYNIDLNSYVWFFITR